MAARLTKKMHILWRQRCGWADRIEKRAGTNMAVVAMAHKNASICFAMLHDDTKFGEKHKKMYTKTTC